MSARTYRAGDVVRHLALDQEWLLACDEDHGRIAACGWPESWNRVEEVELVHAASDEERLERLRETAALHGGDSRAAAARRQLAAMTPAEGPLDAIERRGKALGWDVSRRTDHEGRGWMTLSRRLGVGGQYVSYNEHDRLFSSSPTVCAHDIALLERDCAAFDLLRNLIAKANATEAALADMRREIEALQGLLGVSHG